jgi:hypothetical protein
MECAKCGRERYLAETLLTLDGMDVRVGDLIGSTRHSGCCGHPKLVELALAPWA